jgi:acetyltransferase-like isoleucine patch superfamily enzyme
MFAMVRRFWKMRLPEKLSVVSRRLLLLKAAVYYKYVFASFGRGSTLGKPALLTNPHLIHIGNNVNIRQMARIEAVACDDTYTPEFRIGDNVNIEHFVQLSAIGRLIIGPNVSIGSRTMILCGSHPFLDAANPLKIGDRLAGKDAYIEIGEGTFIGSGVAIMQNVRIGRRVVIAANSVVKKSIPEYCVVEGNPAVIVMRYDEARDQWIV